MGKGLAKVLFFLAHSLEPGKPRGVSLRMERQTLPSGVHAPARHLTYCLSNRHVGVQSRVSGTLPTRARTISIGMLPDDQILSWNSFSLILPVSTNSLRKA